MINKRQTEALRGKSQAIYLCSEVTDITSQREKKNVKTFMIVNQYSGPAKCTTQAAKIPLLWFSHHAVLSPSARVTSGLTANRIRPQQRSSQAGFFTVNSDEMNPKISLYIRTIKITVDT